MDIRQIKRQAKDAMKGKVFIFFLLLFIVGVISMITGGIFLVPVLAYGVYLISVDVLNGGEIDFNKLIEPFKDLNHAVKLFLLNLLYSLIVFLGILLFVVPGIIFLLRYSQAKYIMMEDKSIGVMEALNKSSDMMKGHKTELFILQLSFIGHMLLFFITYGLWYIYLAPYMQLTYTNYYLHLSGLDNNVVAEQYEER